MLPPFSLFLNWNSPISNLENVRSLENFRRSRSPCHRPGAGDNSLQVSNSAPCFDGNTYTLGGFLYLHISQIFITKRSVCLCNSSWLDQFINVTALFFAFKALRFENTYKLCIVSTCIYFTLQIKYPFTSKKTI